MTNYENDIINLLPGETPRQKYDYLVELLKIFNENNSGVEIVLLNTINQLEKTASEMFRASGADSYEERCHIMDAHRKINALTNIGGVKKMEYIKWREIIQNK